MNWKRTTLAVVLLTFGAMTVGVIREFGYIGFFEIAQSNSATRLMMFDLVISLTLISIWMVLDARARHRTALPFIVITAAFGAAGPLLYLLLRKDKK